jgi:outer membrane protein
MKKALAVLLMATTLFLSSAEADFVRVEMGGGLWNYDSSGTATYQNGLLYGQYTSKNTSQSDVYFWMLVKHPLPIVPNVRFEYTKVQDSGYAKGEFEDFSVVFGEATAHYEFKEYDIIPYYNLLDNLMWTTVDLGVDIKVIDASFYADNVKIHSLNLLGQYSKEETIALPLLYARARVEIPGTGLGLEADGKYITYSYSTVYDFRAKIDYTFDISPVVQPGVEVGYRVQKFDIKTDDKTTTMNVDFSGFYAGLMLRF